MTTLQPRLVRADTLDLQSHDTPSAKDHTRSPTFNSYANGQTGAHHREALRHAEESAYHERKSSPRMSVDDPHSNSLSHSHQYDSTDDDGDDDAQDEHNGSAHDEGDYEEGIDENDEDLEDDLLDKISSSPSIEDGIYSLSVWPRRIDSVGYEASPASVMPIRGSSPNSPLATPTSPESEAYVVSHHLSKDSGESGHRSNSIMRNTKDISENGQQSEALDLNPSTIFEDSVVSCYVGSNFDDADRYLFPANDPSLVDVFKDVYDDNNHDWSDEGEPWYEVESSSDDDSHDFRFSSDSRFIDSGWGGECLREIEDIDFEFVYALHTFVATVEGQANATKGDTMVLLDDSNSYWWLVRVVKDGSIGYLPAEHIETPTERLARLNKHRNIDLSASMLGDNPEKSKNPLKKAMRRRNAKTVAFTAPTYYEPSEYEYDTDEEDEEEMVDGVVHSKQQDVQQSEPSTVQDDQVVEPQDTIVIVNGVKNIASDNQVIRDSSVSPVKTNIVEPVSVQSQTEETVQRSRNGVVRNTDSFFKDDTVETKKISLTPRLLRNDTDNTASTDQDLRSKSSSDTFDKIVGPDEKPKEKEKKKDKKGMLSGLFKRKDKSAKNTKTEGEDERVDEAVRTQQSREYSDSTSGLQSPEKRTGKLQKVHPLTSTSPKNSASEVKQVSNQTHTTTSPMHSPKSSETITLVSDSKDLQQEIGQSAMDSNHMNYTPTHTDKRSIFAPLTTVLKSTLSQTNDHDSHLKPVQSNHVKERFAINGSDSEDDHTPTMSQTSHKQQTISPIRDSQIHDSRPDSAMEVSPVEPTDSDFNDPHTPATSHTTNSAAGYHEPGGHHIHGTPQSDTASTSKPSPSLATHTPSTSRSTPTWSDASLRSYMDNDQDIRDLLIIVHDKSNITPVGPDHPLMGGLFMSERTRLAEMQTQLDSMLTTWISKKNPGLLAR